MHASEILGGPFLLTVFRGLKRWLSSDPTVDTLIFGGELQAKGIERLSRWRSAFRDFLFGADFKSGRRNLAAGCGIANAASPRPHRYSLVFVGRIHQDHTGDLSGTKRSKATDHGSTERM